VRVGSSLVSDKTKSRQRGQRPACIEPEFWNYMSLPRHVRGNLFRAGCVQLDGADYVGSRSSAGSLHSTLFHRPLDPTTNSRSERKNELALRFSMQARRETAQRPSDVRRSGRSRVPIRWRCVSTPTGLRQADVQATKRLNDVVTQIHVARPCPRCGGVVQCVL
jgi:hypothetical protein